jgi:hypothetical protein
MVQQLSLRIPRWFMELSCPHLTAPDKSQGIQTIWVKNPILTASYYKEYLGFRTLFRKGRKKKISILLYKNGNLVWVESAFFDDLNIDDSIQIQKITVYSKNIETDYLDLLEKVRIVKPINQIINRHKSFVVMDCNGIEIVYCSGI